MKFKGIYVDKPKRNKVTVDVFPVIRFSYYYGLFSVMVCWLCWGIVVDFLKETE